jgi:hypothetical protein
VSEKNNNPDLAMEALLAGMGAAVCNITVADQKTGFEWVEL